MKRRSEWGYLPVAKLDVGDREGVDQQEDEVVHEVGEEGDPKGAQRPGDTFLAERLGARRRAVILRAAFFRDRK